MESINIILNVPTYMSYI